MGTELKDTFVQAYNDTYDYINRYLTSKLPTRELIEDALQSVYLDFYRSLITTEGKIKNVRHYVLRIAKHYVADHYRQQPKATFEDITDLNIPDEKALATLENADFFDYEQVMELSQKLRRYHLPHFRTALSVRLYYQENCIMPRLVPVHRKIKTIPHP